MAPQGNDPLSRSERKKCVSRSISAQIAAAVASSSLAQGLGVPFVFGFGFACAVGVVRSCQWKRRSGGKQASPSQALRDIGALLMVAAVSFAIFLICVWCTPFFEADKSCNGGVFLGTHWMSGLQQHPFFEQATIPKQPLSRRAIKRSRQGPNSLGSTSRDDHSLNTGGATDVQVGVTAVGAPDRVPSGSLNIHGGSAHSFSYRQQVRKRALHRACQRAAANPLGGTLYRGRWRTLQQLGAVQSQPEPVFDFAGACNRTRTTRSMTSARVNVSTINVGGFDAATYDTFLHWLDGSDADIIGVQEIHFGLGKESKEWTTGKWHVITSVSKRFAGVAFFIRSSKWSLEQIRFREVMQGRVLHIRLQQDQHSLDLVNVYQFARPSTGSHETAR